MAINQALLSAVRMELLPKSTIDVYLTVLENDSTEATIASGIITASAALADAGIEMLGLVTACCGVSLVYRRMIASKFIFRHRLLSAKKSGWIPLKKKASLLKDRWFTHVCLLWIWLQASGNLGVLTLSNFLL